MEPSTRDRRDLRSRRWIGRLVRVGLVFLAIVIAGSWIGRRVSHKARRMGNMRVVNVPASDINTLGAGDFRIFNRDSAVELVLRGNQVLAGLSPKTVAKIQGEMQKSATKDTSGLGGIIASTVKSAVAGTIGIHAAYPVTDIEDMRYEDGQLIIERREGGETRLFGDKGAGVDNGKNFSEEDAQRFIDAVHARKREIESGTFAPPPAAPIVPHPPDVVRIRR